MARALRRSTLRCEGINVLLCDGEAAFQTVFHFHLHVVPRYVGDGWTIKAEPPERERSLLDSHAQAITDALATTDPETTREAFDVAEGIVRDEAPVIPLSYDLEWKLSRTGLLGAQENGLGITRMAGLAWDDE